MVEFETVNLETVRRGGLAWIGLMFLTMMIFAFGSVEDYLWALPVITFPLAVQFIRSSYSVRRLWVFTVTTYILGGVSLIIASNWLSNYPPRIMTGLLVNAVLYYGILLLSAVVAYLLTFRGGYLRIKKATAR